MGPSGSVIKILAGVFLIAKFYSRALTFLVLGVKNCGKNKCYMTEVKLGFGVLELEQVKLRFEKLLTFALE